VQALPRLSAAKVVDHCNTQSYVFWHSIDMAVDWRQGWQHENDTGRFKRDMQVRFSYECCPSAAWGIPNG
jgi:hypothetical protein